MSDPKQKNDVEEEIDQEADPASKQWGAQDMQKASSQMNDTTEDDKDDFSAGDLSKLQISSGPADAPQKKIKAKKEDIQFLVDQLNMKKEAAEAALIEAEGDLYNATLAQVEYQNMVKA
uniref:HYPK_UBA domain-containing protein n=1 Tax=Panagrellus redivivus TaxID=6233 RepID=A0A7E4UZF8_PANRE